MNPDRSTTRRRTVVAAVVIGAAVLAACGGDGDPPLGTSDRPGVTAPPDGTTAPQPEPTTAPEPQPTPAPEPEPEAPPTEEAPPAEDESLTTEEWIAIGLIVLVVLGALVGIVAFLRRGDDEPGNDSKPQRLADITRASRSIHDSTVIRLLQTTDAVTLQSGWGVAQQQFVDLEQRIAALTAEVGDPAGQQTLQQLGAALDGLRGALSSYVALRVDPASAQQTELVQQSQQSVLARNQQLDAAVNQASYLQP
jgi:hypothetical protein